MPSREMRVGARRRSDERWILQEDRVRGVAAADPQLVLAFLEPPQRGAPAVDLEPQPVLVAGAHLPDRQTALRAAVEAQQNRREVFAVDGHRLAAFVAA